MIGRPSQLAIMHERIGNAPTLPCRALAMERGTCGGPLHSIAALKSVYYSVVGSILQVSATTSHLMLLCQRYSTLLFCVVAGLRPIFVFCMG